MAGVKRAVDGDMSEITTMLALQRTPSPIFCASKSWKTKDTSHLVLVKHGDDSLGGSQQAAILDRFRDSAVIEMLASAYHSD